MTRENTDWHEDEGKPRVDLIPILSLTEVGRVMAYGATKYGQHNWSQHAGRWAWTQLIASALRHMYAWMAGENNDQESGLNHLAHVLANIMMLLDLQVMGKGIDDRNPVYTEPRELQTPEFVPTFDKWDALTVAPWQDALAEWLGVAVELPTQDAQMEVSDEELHDPEIWVPGIPPTGRLLPDAGGLCVTCHPDVREGSIGDNE